MSDCGKDALGVELTEGEEMICLCCGHKGKAHPLAAPDDGFDFEGSAWIQLARFEKHCQLQPTIAPEAVRKVMLSELRRTPPVGFVLLPLLPPEDPSIPDPCVDCFRVPCECTNGCDVIGCNIHIPHEHKTLA